MILYEHRQSGKLLKVGMVVALAVTIFALTQGSKVPAVMIGAVGGLAALIFWLFNSLNVAVTEREVAIAFGPGLIRKRILLGSIVSVQAVTNLWIYGWGIRIIPNGWMFNVSGLDAVELKLKSGSVFRIGTDEPQRLEAALMGALQTVAPIRK